MHFNFITHLQHEWGSTGKYRVLVGKSEGRKLLGSPSSRWEDNIQMNLREVEWGALTGSLWLRIGTGDGIL